MKLISEDLVQNIQILLNVGKHPDHTWAQVAEVKQALIGLKDAPEEHQRKKADIKGPQK